MSVGLSHSRISECIHTALLEEVYTTPKPGLVDCWNTGSHTDMDCSSFEKSAEAITPFITDMFFTALTWQKTLPELFASIRAIGVEAEHAMFAATKGVNTHKGALFTLGIIAAASAYVYQPTGSFDWHRILQTCASMTYDTLEKEFAQITQKKSLTHGESLFVRYGEKGIRGEAQQGFPVLVTVITHTASLFACTDMHCSGQNRNNRNLVVLLNSMATLHDTNVVSRSSYKELTWLQNRSRQILDQSTDGVLSIASLSDFNGECVDKNISPGGSADILAAWVFLRSLQLLLTSNA